MINNEFLLINKNIVPSVFNNVIAVKQLLLSDKNISVSEAVKKVGVSRSAYYKYKDNVFIYTGNNDKNTVNVLAILKDRAGAFSDVTSLLYKMGANILTVNQSMPVDGTASVSITLRTDTATVDINKTLERLSRLPVVISVKTV